MNMQSKGNGNSHLDRFIAPAPGPQSDVPPQGDDDCGLPDLKNGAVGCCARPANKPCFSIHFLKPDGTVRSFRYIHLDSNGIYDGGQFTLKFLGMEPVKVIVKGRNLWKLYDYIFCDRMPWIMEAARDMGQGGSEPVVTAISFDPVKEKE